MRAPPQDERAVPPEEPDRRNVPKWLCLRGLMSVPSRLDIDRLAGRADLEIDEIDAALERWVRPVGDVEIEPSIAKFDIVEISQWSLH